MCTGGFRAVNGDRLANRGEGVGLEERVVSFYPDSTCSSVLLL